MPKKAREISALALSKLKSPGRYAVGGADGLHLRITPGSRAWILRVQVGEKRRDLGLGSYPNIGLAEARERARDIRKNIQEGNLPLSPRARAKAEIAEREIDTKTFKECAEALIAGKSSEWRNPKHRQQWENTLLTYVYPKIGLLPVNDIALPHILECLEPIWTSKTETAVRVRGRIESILNYAAVRQYRSGENPARWRGHLDSILPAPNKVQKTEHHAAMPIDDLPHFMALLGTKDGNSIRGLEFLILTAARSGEVRGAKWNEFDFENKIWTIPPERMKTGIEHRVPLSTQAIAVLKRINKLPISDLVFPAPRAGKLSDMAFAQIMRRMKLTCVPHGFRSTFRDWCGEKTQFPRELAEQALAHLLSNKVEAAYRRGDSLEKRREMMQVWGDYTQKEVTKEGNSLQQKKLSDFFRKQPAKVTRPKKAA